MQFSSHFYEVWVVIEPKLMPHKWHWFKELNLRWRVLILLRHQNPQVEGGTKVNAKSRVAGEGFV